MANENHGVPSEAWKVKEMEWQDKAKASCINPAVTPTYQTQLVLEYVDLLQDGMDEALLKSKALKDTTYCLKFDIDTDLIKISKKYCITYNFKFHQYNL